MISEPHKIFYDDLCPLCSKEIDHYKRLQQIHQIEWIPISSSSDVLLAHGLAQETVLKRIHAVRSDGVMVSGAGVFVLIWKSLKPYRYLGNCVAIIRLVPLLDYFYTYFAKWRFKRNLSCKSI